ncbi:CGNR zinc finger domain-containing protein [Streptomyces sp. NPDC001889]
MTEAAATPGALTLIEALVNSLDLATGADELDTEAGRAPFGLTEAGVADARELREALRSAALVHAGHRLPGAVSPAELGRLLAAAPLLITVSDDGTAALRPADPAPLASRVAAAVAAAVADGTWARLKACESDTCRWVYWDRSPAGRRRWCSMSVCGSRAKMRTYRARRTPPGAGRPGA